MTEKQADLQLAGRCTFEAVKNLADLSTKRGFKWTSPKCTFELAIVPLWRIRDRKRLKKMSAII